MNTNKEASSSVRVLEQVPEGTKKPRFPERGHSA